MLVRVFAKQKKDEESGYTNTSFRLEGVGLNGSVPIRVCYFGKPVMEPVMEKVIDPLTKKPKLDEDGKELFEQKKDEQGNPILEAKKDEDGKEVLRDDNYGDRVELLLMYSGNRESGIVTDPLELIAKVRQVQSANGSKYNYFAVCGNTQVPIEVPDFSTADRPDYRYSSNCRKLASMATLV